MGYSPNLTEDSGVGPQETKVCDIPYEVAKDNNMQHDGGIIETAMKEFNEENQIPKKRPMKQQWGPVIPIRRSSRNLDTGKTMLDKAQEAKRKWNLEDKTSNLPKSSSLSKPILLSIAKDIGLELGDGNPDIVDKMLELDPSRNAASKLYCNIASCSKDTAPRKKCADHEVSTSVSISSPNKC
jgi:hypothetical protein